MKKENFCYSSASIPERLERFFQEQKEKERKKKKKKKKMKNALCNHTGLKG